MKKVEMALVIDDVTVWFSNINSYLVYEIPTHFNSLRLADWKEKNEHLLNKLELWHGESADAVLKEVREAMEKEKEVVAEG